MIWIVNGQIGPESRSGVDAVGWLWEINEGGQHRRVLVGITRTAAASNERSLPPDTLEPIRTEGRSELEKVLGEASPVIQCGTSGCRVEQERL